MTIRPMAREDLPVVARLSGALGYPVSESAIARRFDELAKDKNGLFVAADSEGVAGWIHVVSALTLTDEPMAEIDALIVDEAARSRGVGRELIAAAGLGPQTAGTRLCACAPESPATAHTTSTASRDST